MGQNKYPWATNSNKTVFEAQKDGKSFRADKLGSGQFEVRVVQDVSKVDNRDIVGGPPKQVTLFAATVSAKDISTNAESIDEAADKCVHRIETSKEAMKKAGLL